MTTRRLVLLLASVLPLLWPAVSCRAATFSWDGGGDGTSWNDAANWNPAGVPGPSDDATIADNSVIDSGQVTTLSLNSLTLGDGVSSPTLKVSTGISGITTMVIKASAALSLQVVDPAIFGDVTIESGGMITHNGPTENSTAAVRIRATTFDLQAGATVFLSGLGYMGGYALTTGFGPGGGGRGTAFTGGGGGGHGGNGGEGGGAAGGDGFSGPANDWPTGPIAAGSGGGGALAPCVGGHGGGLFILEAGTATLDGLVEADGATSASGCASSGGGGSGGGIFVTANHLYGGGVLRADGAGGAAAAGMGGGGGSGGRIAVVVSSKNASAVSVSADFGGSGAGGTTSGAVGESGSTYFDPKIWLGGGTSDCGDSSNWLGGKPPQNFENVLFGSTSPAKSCTWNVVLPFGSLNSITMSADYQGVITWNSILSSMTGRFEIHGGTLAMYNPVEIKLGGDWIQTGGVFQMNSGSVTFNGTSTQTVVMQAGSYFNAFKVLGTQNGVVPGSDLEIRGAFNPGMRFRNSTAAYTMSIAGPIEAAIQGDVEGTFWVLDGTHVQPVSTGPYNSVRVENPNRVYFTGGVPVAGPGEFRLTAGGRLDITNNRLELSGDFVDEGGVFTVTGSSLAFTGPGSHAVSADLSVLENVELDKPSGTVLWTSSSIINGSVTLSSGSTLALTQISTLAVRGDWTQIEGSALSGASGTIILNGAQVQVVSASGPASSFHNLVSSNSAGVRLSSDIIVVNDLEVHAGVTDISNVVLHLQGDFLSRGGLLQVPGSTASFEGSDLQRFDLGSGFPEIGAVVVANSSGGVRLDGNVSVRRNFVVEPGAVFDGTDRTLSLIGDRGIWDTDAADYRSNGNDSHVVRWAAASGSLDIVAGSTVAGRVEVSSPAVLQGNLYLSGIGDTLVLHSGASLGATGSSIVLRGTSDVLFSTGSAYLKDEGSWLIFEGTGAGRGQLLSTGPFANILLNPVEGTDSFLLNDLTLDYDLVIGSGSLVSIGTAALTLKGDLTNAGGTLDFGSSGGTLRLAGSEAQDLVPEAGDYFSRLEVVASSVVFVSTSRISVGDVYLGSGTLHAGSSVIDMTGDWLGAGGAFEADTGTVRFSSAGTTSSQRFTDPAGVAFNTVDIQVSTMVFGSTFSAAVLSDSVADGLLVFDSLAGSTYTVQDLRLDGGTPATRLRLRSDVPGTQSVINVVTVSTVTAADIRDIRAAGIVIQANDGHSVDSGNNTDWNFKPDLMVFAPGETFVEGYGKGTPANTQVAGTTFTVTVRAVSNRFRTVLNAAVTARVGTSDQFDTEPAAKNLVNALATYDIMLRTADPLPSTGTLTASSTHAYLLGQTTVNVIPAAIDRVQVLMPGEEPLPGSDSGKTALADAWLSGRSNSALVRVTDHFWNRIPGNTHVVELSGISASSATLPAQKNLTDGATTFLGIIVYSTGSFTLTVRNVTSPGVTQVVSSSFSVFPLSLSSPTVSFLIPQGGLVSTLGGGLAGKATDDVGVGKVLVAVRDNVSGLYYDWAAESFSQASEQLTGAQIEPRHGESIDWTVSMADEELTSGRDYYVLYRATNPTNLQTTESSTFTFNSQALIFGAGDGEGYAFVQPSSTATCRTFASTVSYVTGVEGLDAGGAVALRVPEGWPRPQGSDPAAEGYVTVDSTSTAWPGSTELSFEPPSHASATLGTNWILLKVSTGAATTFRGQEKIDFVYHGVPPSGAAGEQSFELRSQGDADGALMSITTAPFITVQAGAPALLSFADYGESAIGPLQTSATMQLRLRDECGNPAPAQAGLLAYLAAGLADSGGFSEDSGAEFFLSGGVSTGSVTIDAGEEVSPAFYYRTSTSGISSQLVRATASLSGATAIADKPFVVRGASFSLTGVAVGTAALPSGTTSAVVRPGEAGSQAVVRFDLSDPSVDWEVVIASETGFTSAVFRDSGAGDPDRPVQVSWSGVRCADECAFVSPGRYPVRVRAGGGAAEDLSLEVRVAETASIFGELGSAGAGARVTAEGTGTGPGTAGVASSTGHFQLYGLAAGRTYNVLVETEAVISGRLVRLSTRAVSVSAALGGTDAGSLSFPTTAFLRVSVIMPIAAPAEFWGELRAYNADRSEEARGTLHFPRGGANSDDGAHTLGRTASTWTVLSLPPDTYELAIELTEVGVSTRISGVLLSSWQVADMPLRLTQKATLSGHVLLPSTKTFGAWVSVQATLQGSTVPTAVGGGFVQPASGGVVPTSAPYRLYGLDTGTWNLRASGDGFLSSTAAVVVSSLTDVTGPDMSLGYGAAITGTVTVVGDTTHLSTATGLFSVHVEAYSPDTFRRVRAAVELSTGAVLSSETFTLSGLEPGGYLVDASLRGYEKDPPGAVSVTASTSAPASTALSLERDSSRLRLGILLPPPTDQACLSTGAFKTVGLFVHGPEIEPTVTADLTTLSGVGGSTVALHCTSMSLLSPAYGDGMHYFELMHSVSGNIATLFAPLSNKTTAEAVADLTGSTYTLRGTLSVSGNVHFQRGGYSVAVSSVPGLLAQAATTSYCLLSSTSPVGISAAHVELIPLGRHGDLDPGPLLPAGASCSSYTVSMDGGGPSLIAYLAVPRADGAFSIEGVPPGAYVLRGAAELDGDPDNGPEAAAPSRVVTVSTDTRADLEIGGGVRISGAVFMPRGTEISRSAAVDLLDAEGETLRTAVVHFRNQEGGTYAIERVPDGDYVLSVRDLGYPTAFAGKPLSVSVAGADVEYADLRMTAAGSMKGRIAVETVRPDGTRESVLITADNAALLPASLRIVAVAEPWFGGGFFSAEGAECSPRGCAPVALDDTGRFTIPAMLPGTYNVEFNVGSADSDVLEGRVDLVSGARSGVSLAEGAIADLGTVRLRAGASLSGRVTDSGGAALAGIPVEARPSAKSPGGESRRREPPKTRTDNQGWYLLRALDPETRFYDVYAGGRAHSLEASDASDFPSAGRGDGAGSGRSTPYETKVVTQVDLQSTTTLNFSLLSAPHSIGGRIAAASGEALFSGGERGREPGALLYLQQEGVIPTLNPVGDIMVKTEADGRFLIPDLTTGTYRLTVAALEFGTLRKIVKVATGSVDLGVLTLTRGGTLEGKILNVDGSAPGEDEISMVLAVRGLRETLPGSLRTDPNTRSVTGYRISGFRAGETYRIVLVSRTGELAQPDEAGSVVFGSSVEVRSLDLVFRRERPFVLAKSRRDGDRFLMEFQVSHPLRDRTADDGDPSVILSTVTASGTLSGREISSNRMDLTAAYAPVVGESSFTLRFRAYSALEDPDSTDFAAPEFLIDSTFTFYAGLDGYHRSHIPNLTGGALVMEGDAGRVTLPPGAFFVEPSSSVEIALQRSGEVLGAAAVLGRPHAVPGAANIRALRHGPGAYPPDMLEAMAATPPQVNPWSAFYDVLLPLGVRTALAEPAQITLHYSTGTDPSGLNVYWYNSAANAYVLQQDVTGAAPVIDEANRTVTIHVNHFSTFVLFETGVAVISGAAFPGGQIEAFNFPNPFDLSVKTVTPIHGIPAQTVRGTMIRFALPADAAGDGVIHIFNVIGEKVRTIDLGNLAGGQYYYQAWDGRNDSGRDAASGVYIGQVKVGGKSAFFKMALIK